MSRPRVVFWLMCLVVAATVSVHRPQAAGAATLSVGSAQPAAPSTGFQIARSRGPTPMPSTEEVDVTLISLGPGNWTLVARSLVVNPGSPDLVHCRIAWEGTGPQVDSATAFIGAGFDTDTITNLGTVSTPFGNYFTLICRHDSNDGNQAYVDVGATLAAFPAPGGNHQLLARSTDPVLVGSPATVVRLQVPAGQWLVGFKATLVNLGAPASVACKVTDGRQRSVSRVIGGGALDHSTSTLFGLDVANVATPTSVALRCTGPDNSSVDDGAVLWARRVASTGVANGCGTAVNATTDLLVGLADRPSCVVPDDGIALTRLGLDAGEWAILGFVNADGDTDRDVTCSITDSSGRGGDDTSSAHLTSAGSGFESGLTLVGATSVPTATVAKLGCDPDGDGDIAASALLVALRL